MANDAEVWSRILRGDVATFDTFYRDYAPRLQLFLRQMVGSHEAAEDITQETFLQIWNRPNGFQSDRGTLRSYLYGIGRKRAAECGGHIRRQQRAIQSRALSAERKPLRSSATCSIVSPKSNGLCYGSAK